MMKESEYILNNQIEFLQFLKKKFALIHRSNLFFRDFHYGLLSYLEVHGKKVGYSTAEAIARQVGEGFEQNGIFKKIDHQSWLLNYPEFALPRVEKTEAKAEAKTEVKAS